MSTTTISKPRSKSEHRDEFRDLVDEHASDSSFKPLQSDERLRPLIGSLWNCTDIMPSDLCDALDLHLGSTYAQGVRSLASAAKA
jgi:hypothetical protein